jgi:hypothetical protein
LIKHEQRNRVSQSNSNDMKCLVCFFVWFAWMIAPVAAAQQPGDCSFLPKGSDAFQTGFFCNEATWVNGLAPWNHLDATDTTAAYLQQWTHAKEDAFILASSEPMLLQSLSKTCCVSEAKPLWLALTIINSRDPNSSRRIIRLSRVKQLSRHLIAGGFSVAP